MHALRFAVAAALGLLVTTARAEIVTRTVEYKQGDAVLEGLLAYDTAGPARKPGVLVVPDWMGVTADSRKKVERLAAMGYVAFAADIYGKGVRPASGKEAGPLAGKYKGDRKLLRARVVAAYDELARQPNVEANRIAAIGYCFGGTTAIELGRAGAPAIGIVSFHGGLDSPTPADGKNIKGKVLALHGADDPFVSAADLAAFEQEMRASGVDWQLVKYGDAVHSFTNPAAGNDKSKGNAYDARADRRSWKAMEDFFAEIFAKG